MARFKWKRLDAMMLFGAAAVAVTSAAFFFFTGGYGESVDPAPRRAGAHSGSFDMELETAPLHRQGFDHGTRGSQAVEPTKPTKSLGAPVAVSAPVRSLPAGYIKEVSSRYNRMSKLAKEAEAGLSAKMKEDPEIQHVFLSQVQHASSYMRAVALTHVLQDPTFEAAFLELLGDPTEFKNTKELFFGRDVVSEKGRATDAIVTPVQMLNQIKLGAADFEKGYLRMKEKLKIDDSTAQIIEIYNGGEVGASLWYGYMKTKGYKYDPKSMMFTAER